jgi:hypothetical protein
LFVAETSLSSNGPFIELVPVLINPEDAREEINCRTNLSHTGDIIERSVIGRIKLPTFNDHRSLKIILQLTTLKRFRAVRKVRALVVVPS